MDPVLRVLPRLRAAAARVRDLERQAGMITRIPAGALYELLAAAEDASANPPVVKRVDWTRAVDRSEVRA